MSPLNKLTARVAKEAEVILVENKPLSGSETLTPQALLALARGGSTVVDEKEAIQIISREAIEKIPIVELMKLIQT